MDEQIEYKSLEVGEVEDRLQVVPLPQLAASMMAGLD